MSAINSFEGKAAIDSSVGSAGLRPRREEYVGTNGAGVRAGFKVGRTACRIGTAIERAAPKASRAGGFVSKVVTKPKKACNSFEADTPVVMGDGASTWSPRRRLRGSRGWAGRWTRSSVGRWRRRRRG